jgi:hypothetical protein
VFFVIDCHESTFATCLIIRVVGLLTVCTEVDCRRTAEAVSDANTTSFYCIVSSGTCCISRARNCETALVEIDVAEFTACRAIHTACVEDTTFATSAETAMVRGETFLVGNCNAVTAFVVTSCHHF